MKDRRNSILKWQTGTFCLAMIFLVGPVSAWAQSEKRTVFAPDDFHWQGNLKAGQTLEVINRNGEIEASSASGGEARVENTRRNVLCRDLNSVVEAATTNGNVEVSTSEWTSARTTNGGVRVSMGNAKWNGELEVKTTNGNVDVSLPATAEFKVNAGTTNGKIHTDFPITVQGSLSSKDLSGTVGGGGRELKVVTTNGTIKLMKS